MLQWPRGKPGNPASIQYYQIAYNDDTPYPFNGNWKFDQIRGAIWWPAVYQTHVNGCSMRFCIQTSEIDHMNLYLRVTYFDSIQQYVAN